ncbi:MAG: DUF3224 domain-containing protein [Tannerella sp.]|jgi:hypothetical protein|nr:DUF3224 domain-containing protein [Tannerella sp.]
MKVKSEFSVSKWNETKCGDPVNGMLLSNVSATFEASGAINGKLEVEYVMHYTNYNTENLYNATASYVGYLVFNGSVEGKSGSFVLEDKGIYTPAGPVSTLTVKPETGTGDLTGISGTGSYFAEGEKMVIELEFS